MELRPLSNNFLARFDSTFFSIQILFSLKKIYISSLKENGHSFVGQVIELGRLHKDPCFVSSVKTKLLFFLKILVCRSLVDDVKILDVGRMRIKTLRMELEIKVTYKVSI